MQSEDTKEQKHPVILKLKQKFPEAVLSVQEFRRDNTIIIKRENLLDVMQFLRDEPSLAFNHLSSISGVDYLNLNETDRFCIIYNLISYKYNHRIALKVYLPEEEPSIESVYSIWKTADWQEREIYDLFGITFHNHPNLIRIFLPDDFKGHPLRKDYPLKGQEERYKH